MAGEPVRDQIQRLRPRGLFSRSAAPAPDALRDLTRTPPVDVPPREAKAPVLTLTEHVYSPSYLIVSETVWPSAWTPASVRDAPVTRASSPHSRRASRVSSAWIVGGPGCACQPA